MSARLRCFFTHRRWNGWVREFSPWHLGGRRCLLCNNFLPRL